MWIGVETSTRACGEVAPVLIAEQGGRVSGFFTLRMISADRAEIVLNAVHPDAQGQGIYGRLLDRVMALCTAAGRKHISVSTQIINIPAQRAWARRGFRLENSLYTLHKWFD